MARSRNIKPGFFKNDLLAEIHPLGRLLFAGLWTMADREGRLEDRPKRIKAEILGYDNCEVESLLNDLRERGFIVRYDHNGTKYIQVVNWLKHQQPHYKEPASEIPPPPGHVDSGVIAFGVSEADRQRIFDRDNRQCVLCGATDRLSLDHIIARSKGGTDDDDNLRTLCVSCNSSKNNRDASSTSAQRRPDVEINKVLDDPLIPLTVNPKPLTDSGLLTPPKPPRGRRTVEESPEFVAFYDAYPRHQGRDAAWTAWQKVDPDEKLAAEIRGGLAGLLPEYRSRPPDKVPLPSTFLNGGRWKDTPIPVHLNGNSPPNGKPHEMSPDFPAWERAERKRLGWDKHEGTAA